MCRELLKVRKLFHFDELRVQYSRHIFMEFGSDELPNILACLRRLLHSTAIIFFSIAWPVRLYSVLLEDESTTSQTSCSPPKLRPLRRFEASWEAEISLRSSWWSSLRPIFFLWNLVQLELASGLLKPYNTVTLAFWIGAKQGETEAFSFALIGRLGVRRNVSRWTWTSYSRWPDWCPQSSGFWASGITKHLFGRFQTFPTVLNPPLSLSLCDRELCTSTEYSQTDVYPSWRVQLSLS